MQTKDKLIVLTDITKKYNGRTVIQNVNHEFRNGESVAFMGHNGCGKSTLLKIIASLTAPTSGHIGYGRKLSFSYVPEKFAPYKLNARVYLEKIGMIEGIAAKELRKRIESLAEDFHVSEMLDVSMQSLSKGTLQKMGVIQALLQTPDVMLLDEPLSGQDISSQKVFVSKINALRNEGTMVLMSCHEPALVNAISEQVYTIDNGCLVEKIYISEQVFTLILDNPQNLPVPEEFERYGTGYSAKVNQSETQKTIVELIQKGWIMKGMFDDVATADKI